MINDWMLTTCHVYRVAVEIWESTAWTVCRVRMVCLDRKVDKVRCLEVAKAGMVSLAYREDVEVPADMELEVCHLHIMLIA